MHQLVRWHLVHFLRTLSAFNVLSLPPHDNSCSLFLSLFCLFHGTIGWMTNNCYLKTKVRPGRSTIQWHWGLCLFLRNILISTFQCGMCMVWSIKTSFMDKRKRTTKDPIHGRLVKRPLFSSFWKNGPVYLPCLVWSCECAQRRVI